MRTLQRSVFPLAVLAALALGGCGGGSDGAAPTQLALNPVTPPPAVEPPTPTVPVEKPAPTPLPPVIEPVPVPLPEPVPAPTPTPPVVQPALLDVTPFVKMTAELPCTERHNRLYTIDQTWVLHSSAGNCADAAYSISLYKGNTDTRVCSHGQTIAGPITNCAPGTDAQQRAWFESLVNNVLKVNLGLDASHSVVTTDLGVPLPQREIASSPWSGIEKKQNLVIRDRDTLVEVWNRHTNGTPVPQVDFNSEMVLALFSNGESNGCYQTQVTKVRLAADRVLAVRTDIAPAPYTPGAPILICPAAISHPVHMVAVRRIDIPVEFIEKQAER